MRTVAVLVAYSLAALLFVLPLAGILKRTLVLPDVFLTVVHWGIFTGAPLAALLAWHYPRLGWYGAGGPARESLDGKDALSATNAPARNKGSEDKI